MACARNERHRYGQHYTPRRVAGLLANFAVRNAGDLVLDPSCGDGRLLEAALERKFALTCNPRARRKLAAQLFGIDRSLEAISKAQHICGHAAAVDFFDLQPGSHFPSSFDAIIGNPPYIRQELMGDADKVRIARTLRAFRDRADEISWPQFSGRSDIYVFFFAHAINFLRDGGRLAFLTSASWLDSGYGVALREFFVQNFRIVAVVESAVESFFDDASVNTTITVLERCLDKASRNGNQVRFARLLEPIGDDSRALARQIERLSVSETSTSLSARSVIQSDLESADGWGRHLRAARVFFSITERAAGLRRLGELARVRFGVKTGANEFFYVESARAGTSLRALREVATVRRGLTTGANEFFYLKKVDSDRRRDGSTIPVQDTIGRQHLIEARYLSPVAFSLKELPGIMMSRPPGGKLFFNCHLALEHLNGTLALDYIRTGERAGYHLRPTCSTREPWYSVARGMKPAPLLFPSKVGERWLIALNRAGVFEDKKLYGVFPGEGVNADALAALLNSTWARYYAEVTCRQMTGAQAIADIDVNVASRILIPDPRGLSEYLEQELLAALETLATRRVLSVFEEVNQPDRRKLDELTLEAMGFDSARERQAMLEQLYHAVVDLVRRRIAGSRNK